jgi:hypothetical protein
MPVPTHRWFTAIAEGVAAGLANGAFSLPLLVSLILLPVFAVPNRRDPALLLFAALIAALAGRIILFPSADVRLSAPIFAGLYVVLAAALPRYLRAISQHAVSDTYQLSDTRIEAKARLGAMCQ